MSSKLPSRSCRAFWHRLICPDVERSSAIPRFKTAIRRRDLSRPVKSALADGLVNSLMTFFDYGCGHGEDIDLLSAQGFQEGVGPSLPANRAHFRGRM